MGVLVLMVLSKHKLSSIIQLAFSISDGLSTDFVLCAVLYGEQWNDYWKTAV
jgi:hypothetical protein